MVFGFALATLIMFANVVARYAFNTGFTWALESVQYLFAWVVLVGAAYGIRVGAHLGLSIFVEKFPPRYQKWLLSIAFGLTFLFVASVFILSLIYTVKIYSWGDLTLDLRIPQWIPYLAIPIGFGLMILHLIQIGINIWQGKILKLTSAESDIVAKN